jgi:signal transduction histidine kinase
MTETAKQPLDLNETIREVIVLTRSEMNGKCVDLRLNLAPDLPPVLGDRVQLEQVMLNLILNGIDAMHTVKGRNRELTIETAVLADREALTTVRDFGVGHDPRTVAQIFEAFHTTKPGSLGMGLSISRSIVESHGGRLWATADDASGATFQFTLSTHPPDPLPAL